MEFGVLGHEVALILLNEEVKFLLHFQVDSLNFLL